MMIYIEWWWGFITQEAMKVKTDYPMRGEMLN